MKYDLFKYALIALFFQLIISTAAYAGNSSPMDSSMSKIKNALSHKKMDMNKAKDSLKSNVDTKMKSQSANAANTMQESTKDKVKKAAAKVIKLKALDKNKDGKIYQCTMHWDQLSDKPGKCPQCGMEMTELTLKQAGKILKDHGFKVK